MEVNLCELVNQWTHSILFTHTVFPLPATVPSICESTNKHKGLRKKLEKFSI